MLRPLCTRGHVRGEQGSVEQRAEAGEGRGDRPGGADGDDRDWDAGVAAEEAGAPAGAVGGPVDSEEGGRAVDAMAVHELDDGVVREPAGGSLAAPDDRGELDRLIPFRVERELLVALGDHPPALERHEAASAEVENVGQQPFDPLAGVDGDGDDWQVLGECEQAVGLERLPGAEALDAAQNDAGEDVVVGVMDNPADVPHNVALEGGGIDEKGEVVGKRGTSRVSAQVKPGNYTFYCSVPGHREGGMEGTLTVK